MNVEDSYEGAVRRLRRLGHAEAQLAPPPDDTEERLRDLEQLATLACDDNDRLTRELDSARGEIDRLHRMVGALQETLANAQPEASFGAQKSRGRGAAFYFFAIAILGAGAAALFVTRPWERLQRAPVAAAMAAPVVTQPLAPVVTPVVTAAPAPSPPIVVPKAEPMIPKVAQPTAVAPTPRAAAVAKTTRAQRRHAAKHHAAKSARHHASKHRAAARSAEKPAVPETDDPLGGVNL